MKIKNAKTGEVREIKETTPPRGWEAVPEDTRTAAYRNRITGQKRNFIDNAQPAGWRRI